MSILHAILTISLDDPFCFVGSAEYGVSMAGSAAGAHALVLRFLWSVVTRYSTFSTNGDQSHNRVKYCLFDCRKLHKCSRTPPPRMAGASSTTPSVQNWRARYVTITFIAQTTTIWTGTGARPVRPFRANLDNRVGCG